jgi:methylmalonyl-CoA/ethylmalonyl-CoA epimerase
MLYETKVADLVDPLQNARLALYTNYSNSYVELIQPLNESSYTWRSLVRRGAHFNHFCYEVEDMPELRSTVSRMRMLKVLGPIPALLFEGRHVCFYYNRNEQIVEFLINDITE